MTLSDRVASVSFRRLVWLLPATLLVHELEEWNISAWYREQFWNPPATHDFAVRTLLATISLLGAAWTALACSFQSSRATAHFVLPFFVPFVFANNLQHIYWLLSFGAYAPGVLASALLNGPAILLISWHAHRNRLVSGRYLGALYLFAAPLLAQAVWTGRSVSPAMLHLHEFGTWFAGVIFGAA